MSMKSFIGMTLVCGIFSVSNSDAASAPARCVKLSGTPLIDAKREFQSKMLAATSDVNDLKAVRDRMRDFQKAYVDTQVPEARFQALSRMVTKQQKLLDQGISCDRFPDYKSTLQQFTEAILEAQQMSSREARTLTPPKPVIKPKTRDTLKPRDAIPENSY